MSSAKRERQQFVTENLFEPEDGAVEHSAMKQLLSEKIAEYRARRDAPGDSRPQMVQGRHAVTPARARAARIAAIVAERYAHLQSYRDYLAEEAARAIHQAEAASELARQNAKAVAAAQYELLAALEQSRQSEAAVLAEESQSLLDFEHGESVSETSKTEIAENAVRRLRVEFPGLNVNRGLPETGQQHGSEPVLSSGTVSLDSLSAEEETQALEQVLDEEIAFRLSPVFAEPSPLEEIQGNLIEFPRHLVAPRRARPRLAEGPLRENLDAQTGPSQLRIFEAEPLVVADTPEYPASASVEPAAPEWSSILLSPQPAPAVAEPVPGEPVVQEAMLPQTAPIQLRLMAAMVDGVLITAALLVFATTLVVTANYLGRLGVFHLAPAAPKTVLILSGVALVVLGLIYQLLFFTWADATPGMRYARIGLCTFSDDNPTRAQMRRRIWAHLLSACPLGLGYLWAVLDDDRLSWHDRITRMYQRSY